MVRGAIWAAMGKTGLPACLHHLSLVDSHHGITPAPPGLGRRRRLANENQRGWVNAAAPQSLLTPAGNLTRSGTGECATTALFSSTNSGR